jgi:hypothetical protein
MAKSRNTTSATATEAPEQARETVGAPNPDRISQRAYELYLQRGGSDGRDWDDWLEAERELRGSGAQRGDSGE